MRPSAESESIFANSVRRSICLHIAMVRERDSRGIRRQSEWHTRDEGEITGSASRNRLDSTEKEFGGTSIKQLLWVARNHYDYPR